MKRPKSLAQINEDVYQLGKRIRLLGHLSWSPALEADLLRVLQKKKARFPQVEYEKVDYSFERSELQKLLKTFTATDPLEKYTQNTIKSFLDMIDLVHSIGKEEFTQLSRRVFGTSDDLFPFSDVSNVEAAQRVVELSNEFDFEFIQESEACISADVVRSYLERRIRGVFSEDAPQVEIVSGLTAKATASTRRIRLREGNHFTHYDFKQLFYHEIMTHALTSMNGEAQGILKSMGCGSPRTLKTQEGLATFSEIITGAIDINRLKRISLRILAIDRALNGADFRETYEFFIDNGQNQNESLNSTIRIFRGGYPDKNIIFTKDCIYLNGLMNIHTLFRWAMQNNRMVLPHLLFCGRVDITDTFLLEEAYANGLINPPKYLPGWFSKIEGLGGFLAFSLLANTIRINIDSQSFPKAS